MDNSYEDVLAELPSAATRAGASHNALERVRGLDNALNGAPVRLQFEDCDGNRVGFVAPLNVFQTFVEDVDTEYHGHLMRVCSELTERAV